MKPDTMESLKKLFSGDPAVMGILNLTPDSFSDAGQCLDVQKTLVRVLQMQEEGMDCLDIGAESTRPGAEPVNVTEQIRRLTPFFEKIMPQVRVPVSIDTRDADVARFAIQAGVSIVNDVSALSQEKMLEFLATYKGIYVLMHSRGNPQTMNQLNHYESCSDEVKKFFEQKLGVLEKIGFEKERVILDPGFGFAKKGKQNIELLTALKEFKKLGCPVLVGVSRKSFLEDYSSVKDPQQRALATELVHELALLEGANILRVHDVKAAKNTIRLYKDYFEVKQVNERE